MAVIQYLAAHDGRINDFGFDWHFDVFTHNRHSPFKLLYDRLELLDS